jgi:hypothetical protein
MDDVIARRQLSNGMFAEVIPLVYDRARLCLVNRHFNDSYDNEW